MVRPAALAPLTTDDDEPTLPRGELILVGLVVPALAPTAAPSANDEAFNDDGAPPEALKAAPNDWDEEDVDAEADDDDEALLLK